jgi:hypothetical protein
MRERGTQAKRGSRRAAGDPQRELADPVQLAVPARGGALVWMTHKTPWLLTPAAWPALGKKTRPGGPVVERLLGRNLSRTVTK